MSAPADKLLAEPAGAEGSPERAASGVVAAAIAAFLAVALALTWRRLWRGADLVDEAFSVVVPWRWVLGDTPFVDEQNLSQAAGLLAYPFFKLYALIGGGDASGLVLYGRHLYLGLAILASVCVFLLARRSLPRTLAALVAAPFTTLVLFETPQLTANALCALCLTAAAALGAVAVLGGSRRWALNAGVAFGLAGVAYPTVLLLTPFIGVLLAFSVGERLVPAPARGIAREVSGERRPASGLRAWRVLSAWSLGGALVVTPVVALVVLLAGAANLRRSWDYTIALARHLDQLGGTSKAGEVALSFLTLLADQWYVVVAALGALAVLRLRPSAGPWLLLLTPPAVWLTGTTSESGVAGAVIMYGLAAPYLWLFVPQDRREAGARLLLCVWAPAVLVGAMTAYTSADGFVRAAVGLLSALVASGLFLAWGLEPLGSRVRTSWLPAACLAAVVVAALAFQVQFQAGGARWSQLRERMADGPWRGIALTAPQRELLERFSADLAAAGRPGDRLLVYPQGAAYYLYWPGEVAANTCQVYVDGAASPLPKATVSYFNRHREVPSLLVHLVPTAGKPREQVQEESGGLGYPAVVVRPGYAIQRRPPGVTVEDVLARLRPL